MAAVSRPTPPVNRKPLLWACATTIEERCNHTKPVVHTSACKVRCSHTNPLLERQRVFLWPKLCGKVWPLESVESKLSKLSKTSLSIQLNAL
jgi:hypothetical protein